MNSFEKIVLDNEVKTEIHIDLEIEKARKSYIDAVDDANQSIEAANEAEKIVIATNDNDFTVYNVDSKTVAFKKFISKRTFWWTATKSGNCSCTCDKSIS